MVTVGMNYEVIDGMQEAFETMFAKVLQTLEGAAGHTKSVLYREVTSPTSYLMVSEWNDEQAFNNFIASDRFRGVANWGKEKILSRRPMHQVYRHGEPFQGTASE